jgi:ABC-type ATPase involved in cell division
MAEIEFDDVYKRYADGFEAVKHLDLDVRDGELMVLVGPSSRDHRHLGHRSITTTESHYDHLEICFPEVPQRRRSK